MRYFMLAILALSGFLASRASAQQIVWRQSPINGHWYGAVNQPTGWSSSEALAVSNGGHLATVRSQSEQTWIAAVFQTELPFNGFWIGLTDQVVENTWVWSSGEPLTYTNWAPGEPNSLGMVENWAHLVGTTAQMPFQWTWNDNADSANLIHGLIETTRAPDLSTLQFCTGDGLDPMMTTPCPCGNYGAAGRGCANSGNTSGALLTAVGTTTPDALQFTCSDMPDNATCLFVQGNGQTQLAFGDGVRCVGGNMKRMYLRTAVAGAASVPQAGDPSVSSRSAVLSDPIAPGSTRWYQVYYRDVSVSFCPAPAGNTWNFSNGVRVTWL